MTPKPVYHNASTGHKGLDGLPYLTLLASFDLWLKYVYYLKKSNTTLNVIC